MPSRLHYYVINLPRCTDRKERLTSRLQHHGLLDQATFIQAIDKDSPILNWFEQGCVTNYTSTRPEHACFLSHIKALRTFVLDKDVDEAIILEDDAMLHNNFQQRLDLVLKEKKNVPLIMLCFLAASWDGVNKLNTVTTETGDISFFSITPKIYGAQGYWINKEYARLCLTRLDKSLRLIPEPFVTSELITRQSNGNFISPPLLIEEGVYSTLRQGNDLNVHRGFFSSFGLDNYTAADGDIKAIWQPVGV